VTASVRTLVFDGCTLDYVTGLFELDARGKGETSGGGMNRDKVII